MSDRGYTDPQLWIRLGPKLREVLTKAEQDVLEYRLPTYDVYSNVMGYIRGLRDVFKIADELQKLEPGMGEDDPNSRRAGLDVVRNRFDPQKARDIWGRMD